MRSSESQLNAVEALERTTRSFAAVNCFFQPFTFLLVVTPNGFSECTSVFMLNHRLETDGAKSRAAAQPQPR